MLAVTIQRIVESIHALLSKNRTKECDESGFVSQSQPTASLTSSPTQSVVTVSTMPALSITSSQIPTAVPSFWLQLTLSKLTIILSSVERKGEVDFEDDDNIDDESKHKRTMDDGLIGVGSVECTLNDVSCSLDVQEQQFKAEMKVVSADAQL